MTDQTVADRIIAVLAEASARYLFGYPGESTLPIYGSTQKARNLAHVIMRCEKCAGYAADGFARMTGRAAVCDAPGGVGAPLVVPAMHEAWASGIPMLLLLTSSPAGWSDKWPTTQCDNGTLFASVSKSVLRLTDPARVDEVLARSILLATGGRPGPVVVDIEPEILNLPAAGETARRVTPRLDAPAYRVRPDPDALARAVDLLRNSRRPLIVAGGGAHLSSVYGSLQNLAQKYQIPVATTLNGKGALAETHPNAVGVLGAKGNIAANESATLADVVIWMGSKGGDKSTSYGSLPPQGAQVIQVDVDADALSRTFHADVPVLADARLFLEDLDEALAGRQPSWQAEPWWSVAVEQPRPEPWGGARVVSALHCRPWAAVVADASKSSSWVGAGYRVSESRRAVIAPRGSGSLGYAIPAAIGASLALDREPVVAVCGDGAFAMSCHELEVAAQLALPLAVVVCNNGRLGLLDDVGKHEFGPDFALPCAFTADWEALGRTYGCQSVTVRDYDEMARALSDWTTSDGPLLVNALMPEGDHSPDFRMFVARTQAAAW